MSPDKPRLPSWSQHLLCTDQICGYLLQNLQRPDLSFAAQVPDKRAFQQLLTCLDLHSCTL